MTANINYVEVEVEVVSNSKKTQHVRGLLTGFTQSDEISAQFIRISLGNRSSLYCSNSYYSVSTIIVGYEKSVKQTFYSTSAEDQIKAIAALGFIMLKLKLDEIADTKGGINTKKYANVPVKYSDFGAREFEPSVLSRDLTVVGKNVPAAMVTPTQTPIVNRPAYTPPYTAPVIPEKEVTYIRRRTKKPTEKFLEEMLVKVNGINDGTYDPETIELIEVVDVVKSVYNEAEDAEDLVNWRGRYGGMMH